MQLKKVTCYNSLLYFSLMHKVVGEAILLKFFSKTAQLHLEIWL